MRGGAAGRGIPNRRPPPTASAPRIAAADVIQQRLSGQFLLKGRIYGSVDQAERVGPPRGHLSDPDPADR